MTGLDPKLLATVPYLKALSAEDLAALALCFQGREYVQDAVVFQEGDIGASMLVVAQGTLIATSKAGGAYGFQRFGPGHVIGEETVFAPAPRTMTLRAATAAVVFSFENESIEALRLSVPVAAQLLADASLKNLLRRLRGFEKNVEAEIERTNFRW